MLFSSFSHILIATRRYALLKGRGRGREGKGCDTQCTERSVFYVVRGKGGGGGGEKKWKYIISLQYRVAYTIVERLSRDLSLRRPGIIWLDVTAIFPAIIRPRMIASYSPSGDIILQRFPRKQNCGTRDNRQFHGGMTSERVSQTSVDIRKYL